MPNTVELHRVFPCSPEKAYRAFTDPDAMVKWFPPHGFVAKIHHLDIRPGGSYKMSFINFSTKSVQSFGGKYLEVKPNELLKYIDKFDDPNLPGEMTMTVTFRKVVCGTEIRIIQSGIPEMIPAEMCYMGWQQSLQLLGQLIEPEIPDGA